MKVRITEEAEKSLDEIIDYLQDNWGKPSITKLKSSIRKTIKRIQKHPSSFPKSNFIEARRALVSKQTALFYKIEDAILVVILFWDARQNPDKLKE